MPTTSTRLKRALYGVAVGAGLSAAATAAFAAVVAVFTVAATVPSAAPADAADAILEVRDWSVPMTTSADGSGMADVADSSPVVVDNGGDPFIVAADRSGRLRGFDLDTGAAKAGWENVHTGWPTRAPLSSNGTDVFAPVYQSDKNQVPKMARFDRHGNLVWMSNRNLPAPASAANGFLLSGMALYQVGGSWRVATGSSGHWMWGLDAETGATAWSFRNAESTMATPAVADLYGLGTPQLIFSNDKSAGSIPGNRYGGHLRIMTADGKLICSAVQVVSTRGTPKHSSSGYNNSSPAVAEVDGRPLIVFGSTASEGDDNDAVVAYDAGCRKVWESPRLSGRAEPSPIFADVLGTGTPQVVQLVGRVKAPRDVYPEVFLLNPVDGTVLARTGESLAEHSGNIAFPQGSRPVTADLNSDGAQDVIVAARNQMLVLDGRSFATAPTVVKSLPLGGAIQNSPVVTARPGGGVRITWAGYSGDNGSGHRGSFVRQYSIPGGQLGTLGWHTFGGDPQLTGVLGAISGPYDQILQGQTLAPGMALTSPNGAYQLHMQPDGNLTFVGPGAQVLWSSGTSVPGSRARLGTDGNLQVLRPDGAVVWQSSPRGSGFERLVVTDVGAVEVVSTTIEGLEYTAATGPIWSTRAGTSPRSVLMPTTPCRVLDTRSTVAGRLAAGERRSFVVAGDSPRYQYQGGDPRGCRIPDGATAVELTVTAVAPTGTGYARIWPSDRSAPGGTMLNYTRSRSTTNTGAVALAATGVDDVSLRNHGGSAHYVVDVSGYFIDEGAPAAVVGARFVPVTPCRIADTRSAGGAMKSGEQRSFQVTGSAGIGGQGGRSGGCGVPAGAVAVEMSKSSVAPRSTGFMRVWAAGGPVPTATQLSYEDSASTNTGTIAISDSGRLAVRSYSGASHLVLDVQGFWVRGNHPAYATASAFVPVAPCRVADTRIAGGRVLSGQVRSWSLDGPRAKGQGGREGGCRVPADATAVEATISSVDAHATGYIRAWPGAGREPQATFANYAAGEGVSNTGTVAVTPASPHLKVTSRTSGTHLVLDIQGWFVPPLR